MYGILTQKEKKGRLVILLPPQRKKNNGKFAGHTALGKNETFDGVQVNRKGGGKRKGIFSPQQQRKKGRPAPIAVYLHTR